MAPSKCAFLKWSVAQKFVGCFNQEFYVQEWVQCYWCILHLHPSSACFMLLCISQFPDFPSEWTRRCVFQILSLCLWSLQSLDTYSFIRYSYPFSFWISIALIFLLLSSCMHVTPWFTVTYFFTVIIPGIGIMFIRNNANRINVNHMQNTCTSVYEQGKLRSFYFVGKGYIIAVKRYALVRQWAQLTMI